MRNPPLGPSSQEFGLRYAGGMLLLLLSAFMQPIIPLQSGAEIRRLDGPSINSGFGGAMANVGDINADGIDDLAVGGDAYITWGMGVVRVHSGADGSLLQEWSNLTNGENLAGPGDVDGDGTPDVMSGSIWVNSKAGQVLVWSGATGAELFRFDGSQVDDYLSSVGFIGDVNGDGHNDLLMGAWGNSASISFGGLVEVRSGLDGSVLHSIFGTRDHGYFGASVAGPGDVTGDGVPDFLVGEPGAATLGSGTGAAHLYSGATGQLVHSWFGVAANSRMGAAVTALPDLDGDGMSELGVAAKFEAPNGHVHVYSGATHQELFDLRVYDPSEVFGVSLSSAGDINGDGVPDIAVGSDRFYNPSGHTGVARIFSGLDSHELQRFEPMSGTGRLGMSIAGTGDVDGDGFDDFAVGAPAESLFLHQAGAAYVVSGKIQGLLLSVSELQAGGTATIRVRNGTPHGTVLIGWSLAGAGPVNTIYGPVEMSYPIRTLPPVNCDAFGNAETSTQLPHGISGIKVWSQSVDLTAGILSNPTPMQVF